MTKFDIKNRFSDKVQFSAEIDCAEDAPLSVKVGLSVKWAIEAGANLTDAYLAGANQETLVVPVVEKIDAKILAEIEAGGRLDMGLWHLCETTHCRAGWAIHLAGEQGYALERKIGSLRAGAAIYRASRPGQHAPWFFASNEAALDDIRKCAAEQDK